MRFVVACLLLAAVTATTSPAGAAPAPSTSTSTARHRRRTEVVLYGEALCPDTAAWVDRILKPAVEAGLVGPAPRAMRQQVEGGETSDDDDEPPPLSRRTHRHRPLASLRYVGWGNAARTASGSVTFQHGPREGELDGALNCAGDLVSHRATLDLLLCYFGAVAANGTGPAGGRDPAVIAGCADRAGVRSWGRVLECAGGSGGAALAKAAEAETAALNPAKNFVPWVTVGGEAMRGECGDLVGWVCARENDDHPACAAAKGKPAPPCPGAPGTAVVVG